MSPDDSADRSPTKSPELSFGIPVRNGAASLQRALDSVLAQRDVDLEVVISDNASTDATGEICRSYAARDSRVRYYRSEIDTGQIANFNRVAMLSRGRYFRWLGSDDWLEPDYARRCLAVMNARPSCVLVTTRQFFVEEDGSLTSACMEPGPDADEPVVRLAEMLRLLNESHLLIDPIYSMVRRSALERCGLLRRELRCDQILAVELSLLGPFRHVPSELAFRRAPSFMRAPMAAGRYGVPLGRAGLQHLRMCAVLARSVDGSDLPPADRRTAYRAIGSFYFRRQSNIARRRARKLRSYAVLHTAATR
ncbi:MAG: glycosyltransferase [Actinomycetota bacterium]|nr:glycosyltransferase [Actinomycetota bacterium]